MCGGSIAGATYWLGIDVLLSVAIGVGVAASGLLFLRVGREFPNRWTGEGWQDGRWTALSLTVANFAALAGLQTAPFSAAYRAAIGFLIVLVWFSGYTGGSLAEMERDCLRRKRGSAEDARQSGS